MFKKLSATAAMIGASTLPMLAQADPSYESITTAADAAWKAGAGIGIAMLVVLVGVRLARKFLR